MAPQFDRAASGRLLRSCIEPDLKTSFDHLDSLI